MSLGENSLVAAYQGKGQLKSRPSGTRVVTKSVIHQFFKIFRKIGKNRNRPVICQVISFPLFIDGYYFRNLKRLRKFTCGERTIIISASGVATLPILKLAI